MSVAVQSITTQQPLAVGQRVMWYEVEEVLSSDPFGITYRARNTQSRNEPRGEYAPVVTIRELLPHELAVRGDFSEIHCSDPARADVFADMRERFVNDAKTLSTLNHPAVMRVHFQRRMNATAYMVMEYLSGQNLRGWLEQGKTLTEAELLAWFDLLLDGLSEVHRRGLLHANLNTNSVWVRNDERLVLTSFGSAQLEYLRAVHEPLSGLAPGYAAIEQYAEESGHQGTWTDVYGLAAVMYRVVTGYRPADALERLTAAQEGTGDPQHSALELACGKYSEALLGAIDAALSLNFGARPQDMAQFKAALYGEALVVPPNHGSPRAHDDVLFGAAGAVSLSADRARCAAFDTFAPSASEPSPVIARAEVEESSGEQFDTLAPEVPGGEASNAGSDVPDEVALQGRVQLAPDAGNPRSAVTPKTAAPSAPLRSTVSLPEHDSSAAFKAWGALFLLQFARVGAAFARGFEPFALVAGSLWRRAVGGMDFDAKVVSTRSAQQTTRRRGAFLAQGQQAQRTTSAVTPASNVWRLRLDAGTRRLEDATRMPASRLLGVLATGLLVMTIVGVLVSTLLPDDTPLAVGNSSALGSTTTLQAPEPAVRHYARATRLLEEAVQFKNLGDIGQARYLAETALNIRPGFAEAESFLNSL